MTSLPEVLSPETWLLHLFSSQAAREGSVIRRKVRDVERYVGRTAFLDEMMRRGSRWLRMRGNSSCFATANQSDELRSRFF